LSDLTPILSATTIRWNEENLEQHQRHPFVPCSQPKVKNLSWLDGKFSIGMAMQKPDAPATSVMLSPTIQL